MPRQRKKFRRLVAEKSRTAVGNASKVSDAKSGRANRAAVRAEAKLKEQARVKDLNTTYYQNDVSWHTPRRGN